jgi:hypothetical protein
MKKKVISGIVYVDEPLAYAPILMDRRCFFRAENAKKPQVWWDLRGSSKPAKGVEI